MKLLIFIILSAYTLLSVKECSSSTTETSSRSSIDNKTLNQGSDVLEIPGLLAFWDFQVNDEGKRISQGKYKYELEEMNGPIIISDDGVFGAQSADLEWGQWFRVQRSKAIGLDLHGNDQELTMMAWIQRESDNEWQYIAGMWNEGGMQFKGKSGGTGKDAPSRQYALFINGAWQNDYSTYERSKAENQVSGYLSPYGGATPDHPFAFDYATGKTKLENNKWYMVAYTYDGNWISVYVNGQLDKNEKFNPFQYEGPIFNGTKNGSDFTVALRDHPRWPSYPEGVPDHQEGFDGKIGGLAIFDRALTAEEIRLMYQSTMINNIHKGN